MSRMAEHRGRQGLSGGQGYAYIALLILIAAMSMALAMTSEVWHTAVQREKEEELLFVGNQIRNALIQYYVRTPAQAGRYPLRLEDLLQDPRYPAIKRYLRKIYLDPLSNSADWELIKGPNGEILGVHSKSQEEPLKKRNFRLGDQDFEGKVKYSDWVFAVPAKLVQPAVLPPNVPKPAAGPSGMNIPGSLMQNVKP